MRQFQPAISPLPIPIAPRIYAKQLQQAALVGENAVDMQHYAPETPVPLPPSVSLSLTEMSTLQLPTMLMLQSLPMRTAYPISPDIAGRKIIKYVPRKSRRKETSAGEALMGCLGLLAIVVVALVILYCLSWGG